MAIINGRIILKIIIFGLINVQYLTASILPVNSIERRAPILNDALTTNETLAAGRNAFLMSHLFERINLKNQQQKMLMNETERRNSLFFDVIQDCPQWLPNLIENDQNQNLIEATTISQTNFENKILEENTTMIATTTEISNNFSLLNDENEATNPFIYPPTELAPNNNFDNKNNREDVQYPYWLKIVFFCVLGFGIAFFLLMFLIGIITRCENETANNSTNIEENVVQMLSTSRGFERNEASEVGKVLSSRNNRVGPTSSGSIVVIEGQGLQQQQPSTSFSSYPATSTRTNIISSPPGLVTTTTAITSNI